MKLHPKMLMEENKSRDKFKKMCTKYGFHSKYYGEDVWGACFEEDIDIFLNMMKKEIFDE